MKFDLSEELTITKWNAIQLVLLCLGMGAGITLLNSLLGFVVIGVVLVVFALPIFLKIFGVTSNEKEPSL